MVAGYSTTLRVCSLGPGAFERGTPTIECGSLVHADLGEGVTLEETGYAGTVEVVGATWMACMDLVTGTGS